MMQPRPVPFTGGLSRGWAAFQKLQQRLLYSTTAENYNHLAYGSPTPPSLLYHTASQPFLSQSTWHRNHRVLNFRVIDRAFS
jgi:hypothetical protein